MSYELKPPSREMRLPARENSDVVFEERQAIPRAWEGAGMWAIEFEAGLLCQRTLASRTHWNYTLSHVDSRKPLVF